MASTINDTNPGITDPSTLDSQESVNIGYVGVILPFMVIAFIIAALNDYLNLRGRAARMIDRRYGAYWREKHIAREELLGKDE